MTEQEKDLFIEQLQNELHNSKETVDAQKVVIRQLCAENAKLETEIRKLKQGRAENEDAGGTHDEGREGDCKQSNNGGGCSEVARTPLEVSLAKKCEKLYASLVTANNERNRLFGLLYGHYIRLGDLKKTFDEKRANELLNESKRLFSRSVKMNSEAAGFESVMMNPPYTTPEEVMKVVTDKEKEESKEG